MNDPPYYIDSCIELHHANVLDGIPLADQSVNCIVTSPPYFGLRDYGVAGQIGAESSPAEYVEHLRSVAAECRRVLADDGTFWLNLGDSYSGYHGNKRVPDDEAPSNKPGYWENMRQSLPGGVPAKNMFGIPWRVAFALQADGWILRNAVIWHKTNAMPYAGKDRLTGRYEHVFMFSKFQRYWFDLDPIRESKVSPQTGRAATFARTTKDHVIPHQSVAQHRVDREGPGNIERGKNPGDVWLIPTGKFPFAHFATFPPEIPRRCILAGCKPGGVVLDPFHGSGTTGMVALQNGYRYVGLDLNRDYLDLSMTTRLAPFVTATERPA